MAQSAEKPLDAAELAALAKLDTPTVCNALEVLDPKSFASGFSTRPFVCAFPQYGSMVGYACTATIRSSKPSGRSGLDQRNLRFAWFDYIDAMPGPRVVVLQDIDEHIGYGAFWGEVQSNVHKALGCLGVVTNGSVRDIHMAAPGFQFIAGSVGPSHAYVHMAEFGVKVEVHGMAVASGDLVHADQHGAVIIPHHLARSIVDAAERVAKKEAIIIGACQAKDFSVQKLKDAIVESMQSGY